MKEIEFEFFECTGRTLFRPINELAKELCAVMRKKNLTEKEMDFYRQNGYEVVLRPSMKLNKTLQEFVKHV